MPSANPSHCLFYRLDPAKISYGTRDNRMGRGGCGPLRVRIRLLQLELRFVAPL